MDESKIDSGIIISSLIWKVLERFFSQGVNLVIQIMLARLLLPSDFGTLAIIVALINYISVFVQSGLSTAIIQKKYISQTDINTLFTISISIAGICYALFYFISPVLASFYDNDNLVSPLRVTALVLFFYSYNSIQMGILSRRMEFKIIFLRTAIAIPLSGIVGIYMAYCDYGLWALIANFILNILFSSIVMAIGTKMSVGFSFSLKSAKELYSFSIKIIGASLVSGFSDLFRTMSIGKKYNTAQLAYYDRAYTYALVAMQIVNNSIQSVLLPVFSREQDNIMKLKELSRKSVRITVFCVTPLLLGVAVMAKTLVLLLLTEKWLPIIPFFMLFCVFRWIGCVVGIDKQVILALGKSSIIFYFEVFLLVSNVLLLIITVPISIQSIAVGSLIVEYISGIVIFIISKKVYSYSYMERVVDLYKPIINSIVMIVFMQMINFFNLDNLWLLIYQCITGIIVYLTMAYLTKDESLLLMRNVVREKIHL